MSDDPYRPAPGPGMTGPQGWEALPLSGEAQANRYPGEYPPPDRGYQPPEGTNPGAYGPSTYPAGAYPPPPPGTPGGPPYAGQPYPGQAYGAYPGPMAPSTSGWAIASLATGIASYLIVPVIGAIAAIVCGHIALGEIKSAQGRVEGRGMAIAGLVLGYAHMALAVCAILLFVMIIVIGAANSSVH